MRQQDLDSAPRAEFPPEHAAGETRDVYAAVLALRRAGWHVYRGGRRNLHKAWPHGSPEDRYLTDEALVLLARRVTGGGR